MAQATVFGVIFILLQRLGTFGIILYMKTILVDAAHTFTVKNEGVFSIFKEMQELLDTFENRKIILTNADDDEAIKYGLTNLPYELFSLKHAPNKTDPEYFKRMMDHFDFSSSDAVYFEHSPEAVKSAQSVGIKSYYYDAEKKDLGGLKEFLEESL